MPSRSSRITVAALVVVLSYIGAIVLGPAKLGAQTTGPLYNTIPNPCYPGRASVITANEKAMFVLCTGHEDGPIIIVPLVQSQATN